MRVLSQKETAERIRLDKKDLKILSLLVENVRMPLTKIASKVQLSRASVEYRIRKMKENELIVGSRTVINLQKLGYNSYHIFIEPLKHDDEKILIERAAANSNINALISYSGKFGMEISVIAKTPAEFIEQREKLFDGLDINYSTPLILLKTVHSIILPKRFFKDIELKEIKEVHTPLSKTKFNVDEKDIMILKKISNDAEISNTKLSKDLGLSKDVVIYRIKQMIENQIILQFRPAINFSLLGLSVHSILIKTEGSGTEEFEHFLKNNDYVLWAAKTFGDWQYIVYLITYDNDELHKFIQEIKTKFDKFAKNYELLFAYKEYKYSFFSEKIAS
jgi:DNA-binding Lrp family transcriptional regulator